jgi:hypothetical protein
VEQNLAALDVLGSMDAPRRAQLASIGR